MDTRIEKMAAELARRRSEKQRDVKTYVYSRFGAADPETVVTIRTPQRFPGTPLSRGTR